MKKILVWAIALASIMCTAPTFALASVSTNGDEPTGGQVGKVYPKSYWDAISDDAFEGLRPVEKDSKAGFIDASGRLVIPAVYDFVFDFYGGQALVNKDGKWYFMNRAQKLISTVHYDKVVDATRDYKVLGVKKGGRYQLVTSAGRILTSLPFDAAESYFTYGLWMLRHNGKWGYINVQDGSVVIPLEYDNIKGFTKGSDLTPVKKNGKWGYVNTKGVLVIPIQFDEAYLFGDKGCALVEKYGKRYYINKRGQEVPNPNTSNNSKSRDFTDDDLDRLDTTVQGVYIPGRTYRRNTWDKVEGFHNGIAQVCLNGLWGYIDSSDKLLIAPIYSSSRPFSEGAAAVKEGNAWKFIDINGRVVGTTPYDVLRVEKDLAKVWNKGKCGLIKNNGKVLIPPVYDSIEFPHEGLIEAKRNGKWGFIDTAGKIVVPFEYESTYYFHEGYAAVKKLGKWGFIDKHGRISIPLQYDGAQFVECGGRTAQVKKDGKWILVPTN